VEEGAPPRWGAGEGRRIRRVLLPWGNGPGAAVAVPLDYARPATAGEWAGGAAAAAACGGSGAAMLVGWGCGEGAWSRGWMGREEVGVVSHIGRERRRRWGGMAERSGLRRGLTDAEARVRYAGG